MNEPNFESRNPPAVVATGLTHRYGERTALQSVNLSACFGEILGLLGPNGSGKTTLFRILSTLIPADEGSVTMDRLDLASQRDQVRRRIGVVFQSPSLDKQLTAYENLTHHGHLYGLRGETLKSRNEANLKRVGLWDRRNERVERFSGGMRRRVELAKGLLTEPRILILDEPSTGLDPAARHELAGVLRAIRDEGVAILLTTHLMEEADRCDRLVVLDQGKVVAEGTPLGLRQQIGGQIVTIESSQPQRVAEVLRDRFGIESPVIDQNVRFEANSAYELLPRLQEALPDLLDSVSIGRPGLNDVFMRLTGRRFQ